METIDDVFKNFRILYIDFTPKNPSFYVEWNRETGQFEMEKKVEYINNI